MGTLRLKSDTGVTSWSKSGNQGNSWQYASASVPANTFLFFEAQRGSDYTSDFAIDDVSVSCTPNFPPAAPAPPTVPPPPPPPPFTPPQPPPSPLPPLLPPLPPSLPPGGVVGGDVTVTANLNLAADQFNATAQETYRDNLRTAALAGRVMLPADSIYRAGFSCLENCS